ncbi:MAG: acetate--CoA ligase family protein [Chroococcidiopsidaceae cyanobacterium CP_BM_RX_35]|nr:acetate--CoA ligase family protein [Chroococcidiopsidaceae cyanobacterium CP_BM_RX_35]
MDLLEYQAKEWFREMGIPVLPSQRIDRPSDLKDLKIRYPVVLKSQVYSGGRGRAGGVKFVENTIDAIAAAQTIFQLPILGEFPSALLAESKYNAEREIYLAVVLDATVRRPILLGSPQGGIDAELTLEQMQQIVVEQDFSPFYARKLAVKMGLQGVLIQSVSAIVEKMYQLFMQKDLDLVEINPLGVSSTGEVMALDGRVTVNDAASARHPDIALLAAKINNGASARQTDGEWWDGALVIEHPGKLGILGNGLGLVMTTLDLVAQTGIESATCLNLGHGGDLAASPAKFCTRLEKGLKFLSQDKNIQVVLINILVSASLASEVAAAITTFVERSSGDGSGKGDHAHFPLISKKGNTPHLVIRLAGLKPDDSGRERLANLSTPVIESLDEAVEQAVYIAQSARLENS